MATHALAWIALAVLSCMAAGGAAAVLHYDAHAPQFVIIAAMLLPATAMALMLWKRAFARLLAGIALAGVSYSAALSVAVSVFHDGL